MADRETAARLVTQVALEIGLIETAGLGAVAIRTVRTLVNCLMGADLSGDLCH